MLLMRNGEKLSENHLRNTKFIGLQDETRTKSV